MHTKNYPICEVCGWAANEHEIKVIEMNTYSLLVKETVTVYILCDGREVESLG